MKNLQDFKPSDYLQIIRRRKWYWIIPALLISIGTAVYVSRLPSVYRSETTILVSERLLPEDYIGSLVRQSVMDHIEFAKQQLRSRVFVERIAQEFQMGGNGLSSEMVQNFVIGSTEVTVLPPNIFKVAFYAADPNTAQAVTRRLAERVMQVQQCCTPGRSQRRRRIPRRTTSPDNTSDLSSGRSRSRPSSFRRTFQVYLNREPRLKDFRSYSPN